MAVASHLWRHASVFSTRTDAAPPSRRPTAQHSRRWSVRQGQWRIAANGQVHRRVFFFQKILVPQGYGSQQQSWWSYKVLRHCDDVTIFEGPCVSWTHWTTAASGGMPWNWNSLGRSYWNWCIESYLGTRPDVLDGMGDDGREGFDRILLEFGVVSAWIKSRFHCWNTMKIFLYSVEDISLYRV